MSGSINKHPYHLVTASPWPILASLGAFLLTFGGVLYMHNFKLGGFTLFFGFIYVAAVATLWWRDVIREATYEGMHTYKVQVGLKNRYGFVYCFRNNVFFCVFLGLFSF